MKILFTLLCCLFCFSPFAQIGPEQGSLIIIGGGGMTQEMFSTFAEMMGGYDQEMIVIPTSAEPQSINLLAERQFWTNRGFSKVTVLHTTDPNVAGSEEFIAPIKTASGIWFGGGRQWRTIDAYKYTRAEEEFHNLLNRGGVIMGSSAGASVQGSFLARGAQATNVPIIAPELNHRVGFGFLKNSAIDQHADTRDRWKEMYEIIELESGLLGFSIAETTAMFVQGDCFEVLGLGNVAVHDSTRIKACTSPNDVCYELVSPGSFFDLKNRMAGECEPDTPTSSINSESKESFTIFPNPSQNYVNIRWNAEANFCKLEISDMMGCVVRSMRVKLSNTSQIDVHDLEKGVYIINLYVDESRHSSKFIKQ